MARRQIECACCGMEGTLHGSTYITACYHRWRRAGFPPSGPPPAPLRGQLLRDEYRFLRDSGETHSVACDRLGVGKGSGRDRLRTTYEPPKPQQHKRADYLRLRQEGHSRKTAAKLLGSPVTSTYTWERGTMKTRPRKVAS